jgi:predicted RNase H-like HicB family nuclease
MNGYVQAEFNLFGTIKRAGRWYIAHCPPLDLSTQGKTISEAKENLLEASQLFLMSCVERGTLDQALKELGFVPVKHGGKRLPANAFAMNISIPFRLEKVTA